MKTPREILLARHQAAAPNLDAIRQSTVAAVCDRRNFAERRPHTAATTIFQTIWLELVLPCRRIWTGLAAVWILILIVNVSLHDSSRTMTAKSAPPVEMMMTFGEQQKLLNELLADRTVPVDAEQPRIFLPKSRTEILKLMNA
jgi:hypothetical protein